MRQIIGIVTILLALLALMSPSFATGVCVAHGGVAVASPDSTGAPVLPHPCEMQGGKRVLPSKPDIRHISVEVPRIFAVQWAGGLRDELLMEGRTPQMELPPPRRG
jgi:hypothetical protein